MATAPIRPSGASDTEFITVTSLMITNKQAPLKSAPSLPARVLVDVGGVAQTVDIDYVVTGNILSWNSRGLDTVISVGDIIRIQYFIL